MSAFLLLSGICLLLDKLGLVQLGATGYAIGAAAGEGLYSIKPQVSFRL